jgi:hypothetical protein
MSSDCRTDNSICPSGTYCSPSSGQCSLKCTAPGFTCPSGTKCEQNSGQCQTIAGIRDCRNPGMACMLGGVCNQTTGLCDSGGRPVDCRTEGCSLLGTICNTTTGLCEGQGTPDTSICGSQDGFDRAFYSALKYSRKKDNKIMALPLAVYLVIHMIAVVWGVIVAFSSQPAANRVIHITLAIVFGPAYLLAYYLNAF